MEPNSYIVELDPGEHLKRGFASPHEELYHDLRRRGVSWDVTKEYSSPLLTGTAVKLHHDIDLVKLVEAKGVRSVTPVYFHAAPEPISQQVMGNSNMTHTGDSLPAHVMTGVDKLHQEGHFGKGIKIGIIDTGVDYTHPALGGSFGPGNKVIGGYDFVGDNYTGRLGPPPAPDNDPLDNCNGHGTHVAGIIGANPNNPWNMSGVAYESEIHAYRVFGCRGGASDAIIIDAMLRAYDDGNDVINMSLGSPNGWSGGLPAVVASRIADNGRVFVVSVGNSGAYGSWYTATPATGRNVISVGSVDNAILNIQNAIVSNGRKIPYLSLNSIPIPSGLPIYATSQDPTVVDDACDPLPSNTPDLSSRLVLIRRGTCSFINKTDNAAAFGARYFLIYNNVDGPISAITTNYTSVLISEPDGRFLLEEAIPNNDTVSFPNSPATIPNPTGGLMSSLSMYGPTFDMYLKPALVTPGGEIVSTMPVALGSWAIKSGTSMAAPYAAGSGALVLGAKGKNAEVAKAVRSIFQNNAIPVKAAHMNSSLVETASWQGAGLINVYNAVKSTGSLLPAELLLNDTAHFNGTQTLTVKNGGKESVIYTFAHVSAGTSNTIEGIEPDLSL
ncbi:Minor extracellular protease vpr [Rhizoctonia solani AG-1 IB]|uniref:Minor extracellular protease vpr n=1 Tax=Thanatephorus cucumeris (strain AG1-IB / isolate 7/3/14) TaxID=1108050 RepID=M5CHI3_THACB|nr:Minor extracellular protease vpr [Rhizoctonia solani AG-1 IB]